MSDGLDYEYTFPTDAAPLRTFDLRPLPERFDDWCTALERRIEAAEKRIDALSTENEALRQRTKRRVLLEEEIAALRERVRRLEAAEVAL